MEATTDYKSVLETVYKRIALQDNQGAVATYIPELAKINPDKFGVCLQPISGKAIGIGDWQEYFSIQSISKVLSLSLAYRLLGNDIWARVDVEPSGTAFNSLVQLEADMGIPRNPFINAGALVICDILISTLQHPKADFLAFVRALSQNPHIDYNTKLAASEASIGHRNIALCHFIKSFGNIKNKADAVLDFYFHICSVEMSCEDLSKTFLFLADHTFTTEQYGRILSTSQSKRINALMQTCGFYDESGEFAFEVGLPGKSGVGGGITAVYPKHYSITVWSPKLNPKGNSYRGMQFLEAFTTQTQLSIF